MQGKTTKLRDNIKGYIYDLSVENDLKISALILNLRKTDKFYHFLIKETHQESEIVNDMRRYLHLI